MERKYLSNDGSLQGTSSLMNVNFVPAWSASLLVALMLVGCRGPLTIVKKPSGPEISVSSVFLRIDQTPSRSTSQAVSPVERAVAESRLAAFRDALSNALANRGFRIASTTAEAHVMLSISASELHVAGWVITDYTGAVPKTFAGPTELAGVTVRVAYLGPGGSEVCVVERYLSGTQSDTHGPNAPWTAAQNVADYTRRAFSSGRESGGRPTASARPSDGP